jgi:hypothetical protein
MSFDKRKAETDPMGAIMDFLENEFNPLHESSLGIATAFASDEDPLKLLGYLNALFVWRICAPGNKTEQEQP